MLKITKLFCCQFADFLSFSCLLNCLYFGPFGNYFAPMDSFSWFISISMISGLAQDLMKLDIKIINLEKDKTELKKEIKTRDETIQTKEKDISELKGAVRNMEKYKYVLNHKIGLLEEEISPKVIYIMIFIGRTYRGKLSIETQNLVKVPVFAQ